MHTAPVFPAEDVKCRRIPIISISRGIYSETHLVLQKLEEKLQDGA